MPNVEKDTEELASVQGRLESNMTQTVFLEHACAATRMLEKRRQLFEVQEALESQKEDFARKGDAFRRREEALRKKDLRLQESLIKFNKFLQENESKRTRAIKRCAEEKRQCEAKGKEAADLLQTLEDKVATEKQLAQQLAKNIKYHDYLASVVKFVQDGSDDFLEIQDVLDRYNTLQKANEDLKDQQHRNITMYEEKQKEFAQLLKDKGDRLLNRNNEIGLLQKEVETCTISAAGAQSRLDASIRNTTDRTSDLGQILSAIDYLIERFENQPHHKKKTMTELLSSNKSNSDNGNSNNTNNSDDDLKNEETMKSKGMLALQKIERIAEYMVDYESIARNYELESVDKKR